MTVSVFRPRKSNFTRPAFSTSSFANCDTSMSDLSSLYVGTYSQSGLSAMTTPAACSPACRFSPSSAMPMSRRSFVVTVCWTPLPSTNCEMTVAAS